MRSSGWRPRASRVVGGSVLLALSVTMLAALVEAGGTARTLRERTNDGVAERVTADPRLVVVALDKEFFDHEGDANFRMGSVANALGYNVGAVTDSYMVRDEVFDAMNPGMAASEFDDVAASVFANFEGAVVGRTRVAVLESEHDLATIAGEQPVDRLRRSVEAVAFDSVAPTGGGEVVRSAALIGHPNDDADRFVPSTALLALLRADDLAPKVRVEREQVVVGDRQVPVDENGRVAISYSDDLLPGGAAIVPARDVIEGSVGAEAFVGATVVVGVTDPTRARMVTVPQHVGGELPAALVDANAVNTLLTGSFLRPADAPLQLGATFLVALLVALASMWAPLAVSPVVLAGGAVGVWNGARFMEGRGRSVDVAVLIGAVVVAYVGSMAWRAADGILRRRRLVGLFSQYVPASVARQLIEPERLRALTEGSRVEVTVLFCDLRGFTSMCAHMEPLQVRVVLDRFYEAVSEVLLDHEGTIMHFNGDEVFGVFGAPLDQPDHAVRALRAAAAVLMLGDDPDLALPPFGIGLNSGEVVAANVGSDLRRQYTVLGDAVNIGARLCSKAGPGEAVASAETVSRAGPVELALEPLAPMQLKGVDEAVHAFVLRSPHLERTQEPTSEGRSVPIGTVAHERGSASL